MKRFTFFSLLAIALAIGVSPAHAEIRWIHLRVDEKGEETKVRLNLPVTLVAVVLPVIRNEGLNGGTIRIDNDQVDRKDVRKVINAAKSAKEGEYVTVETRDETLRVARIKDYLHVRTLNPKANHSRVRVRMPMSVAEALLEGEEEELNLNAAIKALDKLGNGEVVVVDEDEDTEVRVWVDSKSS